MGALLRLTVPNPDDLIRDFGAGALIRIERATTEAGTYAEIDTEPIVAATFSYEVWDPAGAMTRWYKSRYSTATPTTAAHYSGYSDPFSPSEPPAYATLDDLLLLFETQPSTTKKLARLEQLLTVATDELIHESGDVDFRRHPIGSGDETRVFTVSSDGVVHIHEGILSLTSARIRWNRTAEFEDMEVTDLQLEQWGGGGDRRLDARGGAPFDHVSLTGRGSLLVWPRTPFGVEFTGAYGWATPPGGTLLREITAERARQLAYADPSYSGVQSGDPEYGGGPLPMRWPQTLYTFLRTEAWRHIGCSL